MDSKIFESNNSKWNYVHYFNAFNYNNNEQLPILGEGKIIFIVIRSRDSINLFHEGSAFLYTLLVMQSFNLKPENIQILFEDSLNITDKDPFFSLYKNIVSRGGEPIFIGNLKQKKYFIKNAIHIPDMFDGPMYQIRHLIGIRQIMK